MALGRTNQRNRPFDFFPEDSPRENHALSFEGAGRFWKPGQKRNRLQRWNISRNHSSSDPNQSLYSNASIDNWLNTQSRSDLSTPVTETNPLNNGETKQIPLRINSTSSGHTSRTGSDSFSQRSFSSTTSLPLPTSKTEVKSLAQQIIEDERKNKTRQHLMRIMEQEETRVKQLQEDPEDAKLIDNVSPPSQPQEGSLPLELRLSYQPSQDSPWNIDDLLFSPKGKGSGQDKSSVRVEEGDPSFLTEPSDNAYQSSKAIEIADSASVNSGLTEVGGRVPIELHSTQSSLTKLSSHSTIASPTLDRPFSMYELPFESSVITKNASYELPSTVVSASRKAVSNKPPQRQLTYELPLAPREPQSQSFEEDTLFSELNLLKSNSSIRNSVQPALRPLQTSLRNSSNHSPNLSPPASRGNSITSGETSSLGEPPVPIYKEVLTPPMPENAIELSSSASVIHKPRIRSASSLYRRARHHSDLEVYNTLPDEPYPLLPPEPRYEAPTQHSRRPGSMTSETDLGGLRMTNIIQVDIEPEIDPRTGFKYMGMPNDSQRWGVERNR
jgi:hypothetical protein